ncbi:GAF and ANTAR domain-containing protein [Amycolatopsis mongoliensis]|uniref:GAF and ANTAR domain-containing protein n=1 Tax=Amycolatopsis mongoliensis TaxID=715475 RepID=A0A9Y2JH04_9PSEU|nr:GAF and ANTAR domain-containing protein [Amycolatopsis sp. 4-36]WIX98339.1 GAF and ANTAR domain-containing protein [Amycolatopsis sp. 4-36]
MTTAQDEFSYIVAALTSRLAAHHDGLTIVHAVIEACGTVLSSSEVGLLMVDPRGGYEVIAASDERARFIELVQIQAEQGPCLDAVSTNAVVAAPDLTAEVGRWPAFTAAVIGAGFVAAYAFPLRLHDRAVGALNVFYRGPAELSPVLQRRGQALADLAVLGLTQEREERRIERLVEQTLTTLNDRVHVSQAVGIVAGALDVEPDVAREWLVAHSARTGRPLRALAEDLTNGTLAPAAVRAACTS